jgi:monoterpene epsilon-lactone hydrolase
MVIAGDSAGGGLSVSLMLALRDAGLPLPAAGICLSPWTDLALTGRTLIPNSDADYLNVVGLRRVIPEIVQDVDPHEPLLSPIYADLQRIAAAVDSGGDG